MSYAAFIMTFHRPAILRETIRKLAGQSCPPALILVVDNGNSPETRNVVSECADLPIEYVAMLENIGPAGAAHYGLQNLIERGFEWVYWGDDDDPPRHADTIERLMEMVFNNADQRIGAVGEVGQRFDWRKGTITRLADAELAGSVEVDVIAGGHQLVLNASAVISVGLPRKELFFGMEEPELCLRLRRAGYKLLVDGDRMKDARIVAGRFGVVVKTSSTDRPSESLWRNYYTTRNYIEMMRNNFDRYDLARRKVGKEMLKSALAFKHGWRYGLKFAKMSLLGVIHGYLGKMGRIIEPKAKN